MGDERGTEASQVGSVIGKPVGNGTRGVLMRDTEKVLQRRSGHKAG